jgi:hypothetical protein
MDFLLMAASGFGRRSKKHIRSLSGAEVPLYVSWGYSLLCGAMLLIKDAMNRVSTVY